MGCVVTILVPTLNEENYIRRTIASITPQDSDLDYELIVIDGGSTDGTQKIVNELASANRRIRLVHNSARIQSAAINLGASIAKPDSSVLVRADCHAEYPPEFVRRVALELREKTAASVVVPFRSAGRGLIQRGIAAAQNSLLINGGLTHRTSAASRYVEHGHHAAFDRDAFMSIGGYDETFSHNEDAELDVRLTRSGGKIWFCSDLCLTYFPRRSFQALAKQYFAYGRGRARTLCKHRCLPKPRQLLPVAALTMNLCSLAASMSFGWPALIPLFAYFGICAVWGGISAMSKGDPARWTSGLAVMIMHHSWAAGFIYGILRLSFRSDPSFSVLRGRGGVVGYRDGNKKEQRK
jgi:succinoglycan biosynthesis protein ExoA